MILLVFLKEIQKYYFMIILINGGVLIRSCSMYVLKRMYTMVYILIQNVIIQTEKDHALGSVQLLLIIVVDLMGHNYMTQLIIRQKFLLMLIFNGLQFHVMGFLLIYIVFR